MRQDFKQLYSSMIYFKEGMKQRWNLVEYHDPEAPTVFLGLYEPRDIQTLLNHRGPVIMIWGGADLKKSNAQLLKNRPNTFQVGYGWVKNILDNWGMASRNLIIPLKDYSRFKPTPLGNKIYVYKGIHGNRREYFKWDEYIQPLINEWGENNFIFGSGYDINYVHTNLYENCFVFIKPNERGGSTTMWELGHMGRKTISKNQGEAPNVLEFTDINHIAQLINQEAKKIGTIQEQLSIEVSNYMTTGINWLNLDWWNGK